MRVHFASLALLMSLATVGHLPMRVSGQTLGGMIGGLGDLVTGHTGNILDKASGVMGTLGPGHELAQEGLLGSITNPVGSVVKNALGVEGNIAKSALGPIAGSLTGDSLLGPGNRGLSLGKTLAHDAHQGMVNGALGAVGSVANQALNPVSHLVNSVVPGSLLGDSNRGGILGGPSLLTSSLKGLGSGVSDALGGLPTVSKVVGPTVSNILGASSMGGLGQAHLAAASAHQSGQVASMAREGALAATLDAAAAGVAAPALPVEAHLASANPIPEAVVAPEVHATTTAAAAAEGAHLMGRQALAADALLSAQSESAIAGADMLVHGANNARGASLAGNAYRQAKLASARDRVNIAGTVQNTARISDAAIATHDTATKAEDSLLGSELAMDSAATVLDSDASYIPPVTSSLLRSLPYGRLGIRNIIPRPLTYPSRMLPDVWLNGLPVNYATLAMRAPATPLGFGPAGVIANTEVAGLGASQSLLSNNGIMFSNMVMDPATAYMNQGLYGIVDSTIMPILANGQLQAQDEVAMGNHIVNQLTYGAGTLGTYHGYGRFNPVPLITGTSSYANLAPTTTIGVTYPIGSALVIEPRDSFFQDHLDSASSRQNFDERQQ